MLNIRNLLSRRTISQGIPSTYLSATTLPFAGGHSFSVADEVAEAEARAEGGGRNWMDGHEVCSRDRAADKKSAILLEIGR